MGRVLVRWSREAPLWLVRRLRRWWLETLLCVVITPAGLVARPPLGTAASAAVLGGFALHVLAVYRATRAAENYGFHRDLYWANWGQAIAVTAGEQGDRGGSFARTAANMAMVETLVEQLRPRTLDVVGLSVIRDSDRAWSASVGRYGRSGLVMIGAGTLMRPAEHVAGVLLHELQHLERRDPGVRRTLDTLTAVPVLAALAAGRLLIAAWLAVALLVGRAALSWRAELACDRAASAAGCAPALIEFLSEEHDRWWHRARPSLSHPPTALRVALLRRWRARTVEPVRSAVAAAIAAAKSVEAR